jgi:hypothetical protein
MQQQMIPSAFNAVYLRGWLDAVSITLGIDADAIFSKKMPSKRD